MHNEVIFLAAALALGGCAPMVFDKPGATQADFSEDSAKCRLVARGMNPGGFYAQGSASFVAGAAVGNAIGTAANQRATYKDCMMAAGYTVESPQVQALTLSAKPIVARLSVCFRSAYDAPAADVIRAKLVLDATKATAEQLSDPS
jgi:Flp pilus assembly protein CpaB